MVERTQWVEERCAGQRVLHIGCSDSPMTRAKAEMGLLLHQQIEAVCDQQVGIDIDPLAITILSEFGFKDVFEANAERASDYRELGRFDVVVACDVVEHLDNVGLFLDAVHTSLGEQGSLLVTVPNAYSLKRFGAALIFGREHVHPDHTAYFSISTLTEQAQRHGWTIDSISPFMWNNPTLKNRTVNSIVKLFLKLTRRPALADELAVELQPVRRNVPKEMISVEPGHWSNDVGNSERR
jgi:2-polyprenyl-3-methyl-5-hydroxy-6-metoxy-1,4-benzoquinol methylase